LGTLQMMHKCLDRGQKRLYSQTVDVMTLIGGGLS
jgi:hypothetical protein